MKQMPVESFFGGIVQADLLGNLPDFLFGDFPKGKQGLGELSLIEAMQKIALILGVIECLEQLKLRSRGVCNLPDTSVVARCNVICPQLHGVIQKSLELDLCVAQHIRVGCTPS